MWVNPVNFRLWKGLRRPDGGKILRLNGPRWIQAQMLSPMILPTLTAVRAWVLKSNRHGKKTKAVAPNMVCDRFTRLCHPNEDARFRYQPSSVRVLLLDWWSSIHS